MNFCQLEKMNREETGLCKKENLKKAILILNDFGVDLEDAFMRDSFQTDFRTSVYSTECVTNLD